ncbi:hypothetical protein GGI11_004671 [Coemansia sp. RSA 2049]|nr:hypothetical protein GGI11_004671 [Coemansia sp. RSA 2049]
MMRAIYVASILHIVLASFVLWVVPSQYAFFADLVAFPVALFVLVRDIVSAWFASGVVDDQQKSLLKSGSVNDRASTSVVDASSSNRFVRQRKVAGVSGKNDKNDPTFNSGANSTSVVARSRLYGTGGMRKVKVILLGVQVLLFAMVLDFVYRPLVFPGNDLLVFRPGFVDHDSAKLHVRYADGGKLELRYRPLMSAGSNSAPVIADSDSDGWSDPAASKLNIPWESAGQFESPTSLTDYTVTVALTNLKPTTKYVVELHSSIPTLHANSVYLGSAEFTTSPIPGKPARLRFGTGSCIKPNFPYRPTFSSPGDIYGFASMLDHSDDLDMIMFMGDFIYADVPLYFGAGTEDYRRLYRQVYMAPSTRRLVRKVPMLHVYDDHEIKNNWHSKDAPPMGSAMTAFAEYNGRPNPPPPEADVAYYNFTYGNIAFYAWDTRRYRTLWEDGKDDGQKSMLGAKQKEHFVSWLRDVNHTAAVKFVVSSVPVTTGWSNYDSSQDTWRGYPTERDEILQLTKHVPNLFFLSGDRHEMAAVRLPSGNVEFSTSPISQFTFPLVGMFLKNASGETTLHYRRQGHVKYGIIDVDTETNPDIPKVTYSLYTTDVDNGQSPAWVYEADCASWR